MLRNVPIVPAAGETGPPPRHAPGSWQERSGYIVDFPKLAKPLKPTPHSVPRLAVASFEFALRLCLYARVIYVIFKMR
jgi:hypothetical protein